MDLQRIFSQNKAGDAANPLWIGKGNIVAHLTQLCGNIAFSSNIIRKCYITACNAVRRRSASGVDIGFISMSTRFKRQKDMRLACEDMFYDFNWINHAPIS
jgi:hypothetical protein